MNDFLIKKWIRRKYVETPGSVKDFCRDCLERLQKVQSFHQNFCFLMKDPEIENWFLRFQELLEKIRRNWMVLEIREVENVLEFLERIIDGCVKITVQRKLEENLEGVFKSFIENSIPEGLGFVLTVGKILTKSLKDVDFCISKTLLKPFIEIFALVKVRQVDFEFFKEIFKVIESWKVPNFHEWSEEVVVSMSPYFRELTENINNSSKVLKNYQFGEEDILSRMSKNYKNTATALDQVLKGYYYKNKSKESLESRGISTKSVKIGSFLLDNQLGTQKTVESPEIEMKKERSTLNVDFEREKDQEKQSPIKVKAISRNKSLKKKGKITKKGKKTKK